jgi:predicted GIY-YIG superfamily endonuclease
VFYVYIVASGRDGTIYTGGTDDIRVRIENHRAKRFGGFTAKYGVAKLVWYETHHRGNRPSGASARSRNGGESGSCS